MRWIDDLPIRRKLVLITVVTAAVAELLAGVIITIYMTRDYSAQVAQGAVVQTKVLAASLAAPLAFSDGPAAQEYLDALNANDEIAAAGAYDESGILLASYARTGAPADLIPAEAPAGGLRFEGDRLLVSEAVSRTETPVGSVFLVIDTEPLLTRLARVGGLMLLAALGSLLIAIPIAMGLTAAIAKPIREIAAAASRVTAGDLNQQLASTSRADEIGILMRVFGRMLSSLRETMQMERLRALGQLSSGVAHDINNAITPISLYTDTMLELEPNLSPRTRNYLEMVRRVVDDVSATVARLREFSRKRETAATLVPVDLNRLVGEVIELTRARWNDMAQRRGIVIHAVTELGKDLPHVMGIESEIRQALTNLVFNAVDAMPDGGTVTLRTTALLTRNFAQIEVADTGIGMDEETRRRCFEPFFTTKGEQGTGLGMAMVYGVIRRHGAEIEIESAVGKGTTIRLRFAVSGTGAELADAGTSIASRPSRILIVDDDPSVLTMLRMVLETDDHEVIAAEGGQAGIDAFKIAHANGKPFLVVFTDLGMPYIDGKQVASAIKAASPATPVILLTGWGEQAIADEENAPRVDHIMAKPPKLRELRAVLARYQ
jgi:signal transduction histidine kinase/ActR/RegA family two-component response regulator